MRTTSFAILVSGLMTISAQAAPEDFNAAANLQVGTAQTPSGFGDPQAIVCRAPQVLPGGGVGPKICVHNNVWARLTETGKDLAADGKSVFDRPTVDNPLGVGNPDAVTCRAPQPISTAWRLKVLGPEVCLPNGYWAKLHTERKIIAADGKGLINTRYLDPTPGAISGGTNATSMLPANTVR